MLCIRVAGSAQPASSRMMPPASGAWRNQLDSVFESFLRHTILKIAFGRAMVDIIHIHEDDWGMRNLYPLAARVEAEKDMVDAIAAAQRNRDPSGFGYTGIYITKPPNADYTDTGLRICDIEQVLTPILPRVRRFNATVGSAMESAKRDPYGSYDDDAWCFGLGNHCYLKFEVEGPLVSEIWFDLNTDDAQAVYRLRNAVEAIEALAPSIITDYFLEFAGVVSEAGVLDSYLAALQRSCGADEKAALEYPDQHQARQTLRGVFEKLFAFFIKR